MKKYLLDGKKPYYKANLHSHTVISDGTKTPEELKQMYLQQGYSIVAYTDHNILLDHSDLCDENFLALNGYEVDITEEKDYAFDGKKTCHLCLVALRPDNLTQVCYHRSKYLFANAPQYRHLIRFDASRPDFVREYTPDCINRIIVEGRAGGFFVTYNHPTWSLETLQEYGAYKGMNAMEIFNNSSFVGGFAEYNEREYDDILRGGERIFCIAADDNHNYESDSFGGFTMINAEALKYEAVGDALENGAFYASQGPMIHELWFEDGKMGIRCSDAERIVLSTGIRRAETAYPDGNGPLNGAVFHVQPNDRYVRITVTDAAGFHANTRAYFVDDLI